MTDSHSNGPIVPSWSSAADSEFLYLLLYILVAATFVAGLVTATLMSELF